MAERIQRIEREETGNKYARVRREGDSGLFKASFERKSRSSERETQSSQSDPSLLLSSLDDMQAFEKTKKTPHHSHAHTRNESLREARHPLTPAHLDANSERRATQFAPLIQAASRRYGVPPELIAGVIRQESGFNPRARSHCGAMGLMQLMPATARKLGVHNAYDPVQNVFGGTRYLRQLLDQFGGNIDHALAGYNAGPDRVVQYKGVPPFAETQNYVPSVKRNAIAFLEAGTMRESQSFPSFSRLAFGNSHSAKRAEDFGLPPHERIPPHARIV